MCVCVTMYIHFPIHVYIICIYAHMYACVCEEQVISHQTCSSGWEPQPERMANRPTSPGFKGSKVFKVAEP